MALPLVVVVFAGCATHRPYEISAFREEPVEFAAVTLHEGGLSAEQIDVIKATRPPHQFPVDVAVILIRRGRISTRAEEMFSHDLIQTLDASDRIGRVTLVPSFLVPETISFPSIQELGVRSLSEYVLVFYLDAAKFMESTCIESNRYELSSSISYILVDSGTSAMLTADRLHSLQEYTDHLFKSGEEKKALETLFSEQARLLGGQLDALFAGQ